MRSNQNSVCVDKLKATAKLTINLPDLTLRKPCKALGGGHGKVEILVGARINCHRQPAFLKHNHAVLKVYDMN
jgi:hypothetical protein